LFSYYQSFKTNRLLVLLSTYDVKLDTLASTL